MSGNENNTFSKKGITFNYPENWSEFPNFINQIVSGDFHGIGALNEANGYAHLIIQKYNLSYLGKNSVQEFQNTIKDVDNSNSTIIMDNTTSVNDLTIYKMVTYDHNPDNTTQKTLFVTTGKNQTAYVLQFYSDPKLFDKYLPVFNKIVSTIKIQG